MAHLIPLGYDVFRPRGDSILPTGTAPQVRLREASGTSSALHQEGKLSPPLPAHSFNHLTDFQNSNIPVTKFLKLT